MVFYSCSDLFQHWKKTFSLTENYSEYCKSIEIPFAFTDQGPACGLTLYQATTLHTTPPHEPLAFLLCQEDARRLLNRFSAHFHTPLDLPPPISVYLPRAMPLIHDPADYRNVTKTFRADRKRWKRTVARHSEQQEMRKLLRSVSESGATAQLWVLCIDIEWLETDSSVILEVGWARRLFGGGSSGDSDTETRHFIVREFEGARNGKWVSDRKESFAFGESETEWLKEVGVALQEVVDTSDVIVGHDLHGDMQAMTKCLRVSFDENRLQVLDTAKIYGTLVAESAESGNTISLSNLMHVLGCPYESNLLHNAGNDAYYSLQAFFGLLERHEELSRDQETLPKPMNRGHLDEDELEEDCKTVFELLDDVFL